MRGWMVMATGVVAVLLQTARANVISNMNTGAVYPTIQQAHDAAHEGDTLFVYPGEHLEWGITITNGITLLGADPSTTILQAWPTPSGAVDRVMQIHAGISTFPPADRTVRVANLTFRYGCRTNWWNGDAGGGLWVGSGAVTISNCVFTGNSAPGGGGVAGGTLFSCVVSNNRATSWGHGGGAQSVIAYDSLFVTNYADGDGGGVSYGQLYRCTLRSNRAAHNGGGASDSELYACLVEGNSAMSEGGGVVRGGGIFDCLVRYNQGYDGGGIALAKANRCTFIGNHAEYGGAGAYYSYYSCLMISNSAASGGGVSVGSLYHCTVLYNSAWDGGGIYESDAEGCIIAYNAAVNGTNILDYYNNRTIVRSTVLPGGYPGPGNLALDPRFVDPGAGDYHLRVDSPCLDAGIALTGTDLDGRPRLQGSATDMGAYEYPVVCVSKGGSHTPPYENWATAATNLQAGVNAASNDFLVIVSNGSHMCASEWRITNRVYVRSLYGPDVTSVDGQNARRCAVVLTNAILEGLSFTNGRADAGGGLYLANGATLRSSVVARCYATNYGGGVFFGAGGGTAEYCVVRENVAASAQGGGIYLRTGNLIRNCLVVSNAANEGGGLLIYQGGLVENCTVAGNAAPGFTGSGVRFFNGGEVRNSIVYGNAVSDFGAVGGGSAVSFTCSSNVPPGPGNITNAPRFRTSPPYHLEAGSPCINTGTNQAWMDNARDLARQPRLLDGVVDLGAYEFQVAYVAPSGSHTPPFGTLATAATNLQVALDVVPAGGVVRVAEGRYVAAVTNVDVACAVVTNPIALTALGAREATVLDGRGIQRGLSLLSPAVVTGFTISNGWAGVGGGVYLTAGGALVSCTVTRCAAGNYGGGVFLQNSGVLTRCWISQNTAQTNDGGGAYLALGGLVDSCRLLFNEARQGGGIFFDSGGQAINSLICENLARGSRGSGLLFYLGGRADHCTVVSNGSLSSASGIFCDNGGQIVNTINYYNAPANHNAAGAWDHACTIPAIGSACVTSAPRFVAGYRLATNSPGLDAAAEIVSRDIDGQWRPLDSDDSGLAVSDVGAFELMNPLADSDWDLMPDGWEQQYYGSPFGCPRPLDDDDLDGDDNRTEALADTNPLDADDWFRITDMVPSGSVRVVGFPSSSNRVYTLQVSSNANPEAIWVACPPLHRPGTGAWMGLPITNAAPFVWSRVSVQVP